LNRQLVDQWRWLQKRSSHARQDVRYRCFMTAEDVKALPIDRKIQIMEAIWEDFRDRFDRMDVSPQQKDLLNRRRARVREGAAQLLDWESVKGTKE
jgi:putative addiction module component (TIGR02574 family)